MLAEDGNGSAQLPQRAPAIGRLWRRCRPWAELWTARLASVIAVAAAIYAWLRLASALFHGPEAPVVTWVWGSNANSYLASGVAAAICLAMLWLRRWISGRQLSHEILGPTRQLLRAVAVQHRTPILVFALRYVGVLAIVSGAVVAIDMYSAISNGGGVLPVSSGWRWPALFAGFVILCAGLVAVLFSNPYLGTSNRRALRDSRPPILLLGAVGFGPLRELVNLAGPNGIYVQSGLSQLVQLLGTAGPVITTADVSARADGQGAAVIPTTHATRLAIVTTIAASARLIVIVLGPRPTDFFPDMLAAASASTAPMLILVPRRSKYRRIRRVAPRLGLPPIASDPSPKKTLAMFAWAVIGRPGGWTIEPLASTSNVQHLGVWLKSQLKGARSDLPSMRWVRLRSVLTIFKVVGLGLLIIFVATNTWGSIHNS